MSEESDMKTLRSETYWSTAAQEKKNKNDPLRGMVEVEELDLTDFDSFARRTPDIELKFMKKKFVNDIAEGPELEERVYKGSFDLGNSIGSRLCVNKILSVVNKLLKIHITHNHHVKRIVYNDVTDEIMIVTETEKSVKDDI